jgi:hypothetical protein
MRGAGSPMLVSFQSRRQRTVRILGLIWRFDLEAPNLPGWIDCFSYSDRELILTTESSNWQKVQCFALVFA